MILLGKEPDLDNFVRLGLAQKVKDVDSGKLYHRLHPDAIQEKRHLIQSDDQLAVCVFGLYFKKLRNETDMSMGAIVLSAALLFLNEFDQNLFRLLEKCSMDRWRGYVQDLDEEFVERFDP